MTSGEALRTLLSLKDAGLFGAPDEAGQLAECAATTETLLAHQPMKVMLLVAQCCNLRCAYCYGSERNKADSAALMTPETGRASVDYLFRLSPARPHYYIYFFGGEPLLNLRTIREVVQYARLKAKGARKTVEFGVTTNGTLLDDAAADFLIQEDFQVCLSLDGDPATHDRHRRTVDGQGSHARALQGYRRVQQRARRANQVKVRATMSHQSHDPRTYASYFEGIGIRNFGIGTAFERAGAAHPSDVTAEDVQEMEAVYGSLLDDLVDRLESGQGSPTYNPFFRSVAALSRGFDRAILGCGACRNDQGIGADGSIYPCHRYVGMPAYVIGDVRSGIAPSQARALYAQFFAGWREHCSPCWARYACSGACIWQNSHDDGKLRPPLAYHCQSIRKGIQRTAWLTQYLARRHPQTLKRLTSEGVAFCRPACGAEGCGEK